MRLSKGLLVNCAFLLAFQPVSAQAPETKRAPTANAALRYWRAFDALSGLSKEQEKIVEEWRTTPLDQASAALVRDSAALKGLHQGAKAPYCDWGLNYEDGVGMLLPHLARARTLARLACLRARWKFHEGKPRAAAEDVIAAMTLGRHTGVDPTLISILVDYAIERIAMEALQADFAKLDADTLKYLAEQLDKLPTVLTVRQAMLNERDTFITWMIREVEKAEVEKPGSWKERVPMFTGQPDNAQVLKEATSAKRFVEMLEELKPVYDEMAQLMALPFDQFQAQWPEFLSKKKSANVLAGLLLPALDKVVNASRQAQTRVALLKAAIAVAQGGEERLKETSDPGGKGPFDYKTIPGGFRLQSQMRDAKGELITFYAGQAPR
jgi:hypothetical protein